MSDNRPILGGEHLHRSFGVGKKEVRALVDVSMDLGRGEMALIMGPSGSGKSTLLAVLSGLQRPDKGRVVALDQDLWNLSAGARKQFRLEHFGFIFQGYNLFPALTAWQQLEIVLRWGKGASAGQARRRAEEMLDLLGLTEQKNSRPHQLSGGEQQRVAIGRALIKNPTICFCDEPTSSLDWERGEQVVQLLQKAARERGATILIVGHDHRLEGYADRLFNLVDGQLTIRETRQHAKAPPKNGPPGDDRKDHETRLS
jgi:putative ABC transport system ATP-binding protein